MIYLTVDETLTNVQVWKKKPFFNKDTQDWQHYDMSAYLGCLSSDDRGPSARDLISKLIHKKLYRKRVIKI